MVDTKKITRRPVTLRSLDELIAEAERLAAAERDGRLKRLGNWSLGQALGHLAAWIDYGYEGFPEQMRPPWFVKMLVRLFRRKILNGPFPQGYRIPKIEGGTFGIDHMTTEEGLARLRRAVARLKSEPVKHHSPVFGPMSEAQRVRLHLGHAELHLGFMDA